MTLTLIHCTPERATIITDTLSYTQNMGRLGHSTKVHTLHHLDAAIATRGDAAFGAQARVLLEVLAVEASDVCDLIGRAAPLLAEEWREWSDGPRRSLPAIFVVGRDPESGGYAAWCLEPLADWQPWRVEEDVFLYPSPLVTKPTDLELAHLALEPENKFSEQELALLAVSRQMAPPPAPEADTDLVVMAIVAREQRGVCDSAMWTPIGGELYKTTLEEGLVMSSRVYAWDSEEELLRQVGWSIHPLSQARPCHCESGRSFRDCHMRPIWTEPCDCGSSRTFYECCMVPV